MFNRSRYYPNLKTTLYTLLAVNNINKIVFSYKLPNVSDEKD